MEEQTVREAIRALISRKEQRVKQLQAERKEINEQETPIKYRVLTENIARVDHGIATLLELEHNLRLCDCPDEAYAGDETGKYVEMRLRNGCDLTITG